MAKKQAKKVTFDQTLPQNIMPVGERVEEDKNIYISQVAYKEIHRFTKNKTTNESGGMLIGNVIEEFNKTNIVIHAFVEAKYSEATPTTLKFTHETWDYVHSEIDKKYENGQIVGWIHTHPDFGIFLSEYDKFIQENFFNEEYQTAYVVDPIQHIEGFYFWINGKIERCKGFYIFDKTDETIEIEEDKEVQGRGAAELKSQGSSMLTMIIGGVLVLIIILFAFISMNLLNRMNILEKQQENLVENAIQSIGVLQQQISALNSEISILQSEQEEIKPVEEESVSDDFIDESELSIETSIDEEIIKEDNDGENESNEINLLEEETVSE